MHPLTPQTLYTLVVLLALLVLPACSQNATPTQPTEPWLAVMAPDNSFNFSFYKDMKEVARINVGGWGPNWGWRGFGGQGRADGGELNVTAPFESNKDAGEIINVALRAWKSAPNAISFQYTLNADKDVPLTMLMAGINTNPAFQDGQAVISEVNGTQTNLPLSLGGIRGVGDSSKVTFNSKAAGEYALGLEPAVPLLTDGQLRVLLAKDTFAKGTKTVTLTFTFAGKVALLASDGDMARLTKTLPGADWFPFAPANDLGPSAIGFESWMDAPAGKHGGVRQVGDDFEFADKTPVKFWGTNLSFGASAPEKAAADFTAARFAKWGVNSVRLHKFTGSGWEGIGDPNDATKMDPAGLERFDHFASQLTKKGVYYGWSHTFKFKVRPGNRDKLLAYDEIMDKLKGDTYAFINIAEDVQDLMIEMVVNLLKHRNPHTDKTYAQDPALGYIELQNEDDIFFYTTEGAINAAPTYKKKFTERWCEWLGKKYTSNANLKKAWGDALGGDETIEGKNISLFSNPWSFGDDNLPNKQGGERQRLLDNAAFFHDAQNRFYSRFVKAIRDTGYQGPLVGSPWQAPATLPHLYNLRSDALVGFVDRHDYFGGGLTDSMLHKPGSGYLSTGLQQVAGHPFGLSEWIHVYPSLYSTEGPPLVAAYGMGLQGWDASYEFQSSAGTNAFGDLAGNLPWGVWNADVPTQIGQFPLLARMIARGDVKQGDTIAVKRVSPQNLATGKFGFSEKVTQQGDVKTFGGSVPAEALAAGRCLIDFTEKTEASTLPDMMKFRQGNSIRSNTGQLLWDASDKGFFSIDTPATKAVVGFADGKERMLGDVRITSNSPYAAILLTAADKNATLANAKRALLSVMARNANTGMTYFSPDGRLLDNGKGPIMLEPVKATISVARRAVAAVNILDHDGRATGRTLPVVKGTFAVDGSRDKALYYEVVFGQ